MLKKVRDKNKIFKKDKKKKKEKLNKCDKNRIK